MSFRLKLKQKFFHINSSQVGLWTIIIMNLLANKQKMFPYSVCGSMILVNIIKRWKPGGSSAQWLERQRRDRYVKQAKTDKWRCRSAYKLLQMNDKYNLLRPGDIVIDCGAAPGSWTQVAAGLVQSESGKGVVISVDLLSIEPVPGAVLLERTDFTRPETQRHLLALLAGRRAGAVLSDMAPNSSGNRHLDHEQIVELCRSVLRFATAVLEPGSGKLLCKLWNGGSCGAFQDQVRRHFRDVRVVKPEASRSESAEIYILATGFKDAGLIT